MTGGGPTSHATLFQTPPPPLKAEWQGGSGIHLSAIDHDELISIVRELCVQFRTPPPIKSRMAGGLRNASSAVDMCRWTLAIQIFSLLTLMRIHAPA
jgi:hypothetical protein